LVDFIQIRLPVVTELLDPLEGSHFVNFRIDQSSHDVQGMDINDDKSLNRDLSELLQGSNNELDSLFSLILKELVVSFKSLKTTFDHVFLDILGPEDLRGVQDDLTSLNLDPLSSGDLIIGIKSDPEGFTDTQHHLAFELRHPEFYTSIVRVDTLQEVDLLALRRDDSVHGVVGSEVQVADSLEHFLQMSLYFSNFLSLG